MVLNALGFTVLFIRPLMSLRNYSDLVIVIFTMIGGIRVQLANIGDNGIDQFITTLNITSIFR